MVERNAEVPMDRRILFRIGIHLGDVVEERDGDLMGAGVNIAARLKGIAKPGVICISDDAYRRVKVRLDLAVCDLGPETDQSLVLNPGMPVATSGEWSKSDHLSLPWTGILADAQDESGQHNAAIRTVRRWVVLPIVDLAWRFHDVMCLTLWRIPEVRSG